MKNTTGLYKHQRDNQGRRRRLPRADPKAKLVPIEKYEYEKARDCGLCGLSSPPLAGPCGHPLCPRPTT
jgi:hypothetical protein